MAAKGQVIIKKIEVIEGHGHHGGAWKVAYADFMTAMMAFFLLMWILSSSDEQKLRGIAEYFTDATLPGGSGVLDGATLGPPGTLTASNGTTVARGSDRGEEDDPSPASWEVMDVTQTASPEEQVRGTTLGDHRNPAGGATSPEYVQDSSPEGLSELEAIAAAEAAAQSEVLDDTNIASAMGSADQQLDGSDTSLAEIAAGSTSELSEALDPNSTNIGANAMPAQEQNPLHTEDKERFADFQEEVRKALEASPELAQLQENLVFKESDEGMLVLIMDQKGKPMFASGQAKMNAMTVKLMQVLGQSLATLPNEMVISGHTDAVPFSNRRAYDNWDLSTDRANAMRRILLKSGVTQERITRVSGLADTQLLKADSPKDPSNRRIEVLLAYRSPAPMSPATPATPKPMQKTEMPAKTQAAAIAPKPAPATKAVAEVATALTEPVAKVTENSQVTPKIIAAKETVLDEAVFENLRSALR